MRLADELIRPSRTLREPVPEEVRATVRQRPKLVRKVR